MHGVCLATLCRLRSHSGPQRCSSNDSCMGFCSPHAAQLGHLQQPPTLCSTQTTYVSLRRAGSTLSTVEPDAAGLVTPHRCNQQLDAFSLHAQVCCKFLHNSVRDLIHFFAQEAGYTALAEHSRRQRLLPDAEPSTARRGHERADLHLVSSGGHDQYIDIRVTAIPYAADVHTHLLVQERQKRAQYHRAAVMPAVLSTLGQFAPDLHKLLQELTYEHARRPLHDDTTWAAQLANARLAILQPLSILLLRNTAVAEGTCLGDARLTADRQLDARHNIGAKGTAVLPSLAASSAAPLASCTPVTALDSLEGTAQ
eukprot:2642960-Amphidinium_carterae.1